MGDPVVGFPVHGSLIVARVPSLLVNRAVQGAMALRLRTAHVHLSPEEQEVKQLLQALLLKAGFIKDMTDRSWNDYCTHYVLRKELPKLQEIAAEQKAIAAEIVEKRREAARPPPKKPLFE